MGGRGADGIERAVDAGAALVLAFAAAFCVRVATGDVALSLAVPALVFAASFHGLRRVSRAGTFGMNRFEARPFVPVRPDELVLTEADRLDRQVLVLDQPSTPAGRGSQVVRLFSPVPCERGDASERCPAVSSRTAPPDASEALFTALAELRRALR